MSPKTEPASYQERSFQVDRLLRSGFNVTAAGMNMDGGWDIEVELSPPSDGEHYISLASLDEVDDFLETQQPRPVEVIRIIYTTEDVRSMAESAGVDPDAAVDRAMEWGKHIASTAMELCSDQLESVVRTNQP